MSNSYKDTMNLPETDFPMRGNLPARERLAQWQEMDIYRRVLEKNADGKPFVLHDGPPYANGPIHIGHAFNKILKDFVVKSHAQRGYFTPYIPGWDCHGQPIEHMVEVTLGPEKMAEISQVELRQRCREWAEKYVDIQRNGFKRLGVNADWEHPYLTFIPNYEAGNVEIFKDLYLKGSVYRGRKPIHWCTHCHTALAEAEIEYGDEVSPSIYVKFKLDAMPGVFEASGAEGAAYLLIWTTTPWTLPANTAVSLAPDADYVMVTVGGDNLIMAKELVETVAEVAGWEDYDFVRGADGEPVTLTGKQLFGLTYTAPVRRDIKGTVIYGDHVTLDTGTGAVHTAPGHGQDDYLVALEFDIPMLMPVDDNGVFTGEAGQFAGLSTDEANPVIIDWLREQGTLVAEKKINHSYPHCWRCHEPVIFRATDQWFVSMDKNALREDALRAINSEVEWIPAWAKNRIGAMVADRPDWCISRQRSWGVPIPVFKCAKCGNTVATAETFDAVIELFNTKGADAWFTEAPSDYLPRGTKCEVCGGTELIPEKDILDVWWESGVSHTSVCLHRAEADGLTFPADMYLEGSDQHRGWFQSSLLTSIGAYGVPPYRSVMHCGFTVDEEGRKMSKSLGNGIDPLEMAEKYGADALRFNLITGNSPGNDMRFYVEKCEAMRNFCNKIWNASRFVMMNLTIDHVELPKKLELEDKWILSKLNTLIREVTDNMDAFELGVASAKIYDFIWDNYCDWFIELTKNRLNSDDQTTRENAQNVLCYVLIETLKLLHPFMPFITEEIWQALPHEGEFLMLSKWPEYNEKFSFPAEEEAMQTVIEAITAIRARRNEMNVAPSKKVHYTVATAHADTFSAGIPFFTRLASASDVTIVPADAAIDADGKVEVDTHAARIFMPLAELVDFEKELARIAKEKANAEKQLAGIENKLKNEGFLAKAPEAVINGARADAEKLKALIEKLDASAAAMKK